MGAQMVFRYVTYGRVESYLSVYLYLFLCGSEHREELELSCSDILCPWNFLITQGSLPSCLSPFRVL